MKFGDILVGLGGLAIIICVFSLMGYLYGSLLISLIKDFSWGWLCVFVFMNGLIFIFIGTILSKN